MYRFKKLLVHLSLQDGSEDAAIIAYAGKITKLAESESVTFLHVAAKIDIPATLKQRYPWLVEPIDEAARQRADAYVKEHFDGFAATKVTVEVCDGNHSQVLLERAKNDDVDLIIIGSKEDDGQLSVKLARKATCSVMTVPEGANADFKQILVPLDFSRFSGNALDVAVAFADAEKLPSIHGFHAYCLPTGYHRATISKQQFEADLEAHAQTQFDSFISGQDTRGIQVETHIANSPLIPQAALRAAKEAQADLIMIGCRGKDSFTASLLGSNSEAILRMATIPVVAVKEKGTGRALLQSLLGA
ncbi:MAG: universal stress protein [Opitutales bacterium]